MAIYIALYMPKKVFTLIHVSVWKKNLHFQCVNTSYKGNIYIGASGSVMNWVVIYIYIVSIVV